MATPSKILIVEDDAVLVLDLEETLIQMGYHVVGLAASGSEAIAQARRHSPDLILMDIHLRGDMDGVQAANEIHQFLDTPIIFLTANTDQLRIQKAKDTQAYAYISKPVREMELRASLEMAISKDKAVKALHASEALFRAVVDHSSEGIVLMAINRQAMYVSPSYTKVTGYDPEEVTGAHGPDYVHPEDRTFTASIFEQILRNPTQIVTLEYRIRHKQGHWVWVETTANNMLADPNVRAVVLHIRDITERKKNEQILKQSQATLKAIIDSTTDMIWSVDAGQFGLMTWNETFREYFRLRRNIEIKLGDRPEDLFPPGSRYIALWKKYYQRALQEVSFFEEYEVSAGGMILQLSLNLLKQDERVFGISVFGKDITGQKKAQEATLERLRLYEHLYLDSSRQDGQMQDDDSSEITQDRAAV